MKKNNTNKKLFSAIAALALSATAVCGAVSVAGCSDKSLYVPSETENHGSYTIISTALGATRSTSSGKIYYADPNAKANNTSNDGSREHPFFLGDVLDENSNMVTTLKPGDTLYLLPGVYKLDSRIRLPEELSGTFDKYIRIVNAALEKDASGYTGTETQCVLDFSEQVFASTNRGVEVYGNYIHWYGIDVCGAGDNGLYIGGSYNTVEYSEFYNNRDSGLQLGRAYSEYNSIKQWPSYNLIKDCTSHNNYDNETYGENADGFAAKLTVGYGNVFDGCIAYRNSDDGWDLYAKVDSGNIGAVIMYNCVAFENGYLEYTRDECNAFYPSYSNETFDPNETSTNPYKTRDGDGNGFKLGGSVMEGDVVMYNCLSYYNRMHGVTDNSNPGYIKVTGVTSFDNSAAINENGQIVSVVNDDTHSNVDVSRHSYSYNTVIDTLSVRDNVVKSLDKDNYRGSVTNSLLDAKDKTNVIKGSLNADTQNAGGITNTSTISTLVASDMFKALPVVFDGENYTYNLDGARDAIVVEDGKITYKLLADRVHVTYRNADHSINMGDILAKSDAAETLIAAELGSSLHVGSELNKSSWADYTHFFANDFVNGDAADENTAIVERTLEALTLNCDENAVYQDFEIPTEMIDATITWTSDNEAYLAIDTENVEVSFSGSKYAKAIVYRDVAEDKTVKLTATVTYNGVSKSKDFTLVIKKGNPTIGDIYVVDMNGNRVDNGGRYIIDMYRYFREPEVKALNGLYWDSNKLLRESEYTVSTEYTYQTDANAHAIKVKGFTPSVAGVYTITNTVTLKSDTSKHGTMSYKIYVASVSAKVDFASEPTVSVYQDGFKIAGEPSSATGMLYTLSSATQLELTADSLKAAEGVVINNFRDTSISFDFENANKAEYYIYFALANANGEITSKIYSTKISTVNIDTAEKFMTIAGGAKIGDENPSQTIYMLSGDLDFTGVSYSIGKANFSGVFNGLGHKISNLSIDAGTSTDKNVGVFYKVAGGTIMNVKFDNLSIVAEHAGEKVGFVSECTGGYFYNIAFTNTNISSTKRVGGLIGHVGGTTDGKGTVYPLYISQVSIVNDADHKISGSQRVAGLIGYVQHYRNSISIDNCYVVSDIIAGSTGEGSGMVASWEDNYEPDSLTIDRCYYAGTLKTSVAPGSSRLGGMLGYHKGGAGKLVITRCISLAILDIQGEVRSTSVKNASPIVGNYSGNADVKVTKCIGLMEEYNTNYESEVFNLTNLRRHPTYLTGEDYLNLDTAKRWTIVAADEEDKDSRDLYKAPYVILNFLEV